MIRQWLKQKLFADEIAKVPQGEVGFDSTMLYSINKDFPKYNPDQLLGKKGHEIYRKMMIDEQVKAVMRFKQNAVASRSWHFDVDTEADRHEEMADFFKFAVKKIRGSFTDHLVGILSGMINGFSITEKIFSPLQWQGRTMWGIRDLKLRPFDSFAQGFVVDDHGNILELRQQQGAKEMPIPMEKVIHFVHQPDIDRHYGESDLRACYRPWWSKDIAIKFQNIFLERGASGFTWAQVKGQLSNNQQSNLKALMRNISARMGAIMPANVDLNVEQPRHTTAFRDAVAQHDKSIAKAALVPNLLGFSEQGQTGAYSLGETQFKAFLWILDQIANRLEEVLNEQIFAQMAIWNFGTDEFPLFCFEPMSDEEKRALAKEWSELVKGGAVTNSESDEAWIRRLVGAPEKAKEQESENHPADDNPDSEDELPDNEAWIESHPKQQQARLRAAFAERPWLRRVNFERIERTLDDQDERFMRELSQVMGRVRNSLEQQIGRIVGQRSMGNLQPKEIEAVTIPKNLVQQYRKIVRANLQQILNDSYTAAKKELPARRHAAIRPGMDKTQAERFLASKAMKIGGVMENDVLKAVQRVLENGIKYDKSLSAVMEAIAQDTDLIAFLPDTDAAGRPVNVPNRIENIARTNTADAMNQARTALFNDPALKGFVLAYEYSAILDSRTSEICEYLHGKIRKNWNEYTPPNHFFCRSLLIPVTVVDDWDGKESPAPTKKPQKGFF